MGCRNLVLLGIFRMDFVSSAKLGANKFLRASMPAEFAGKLRCVHGDDALEWISDPYHSPHFHDCYIPHTSTTATFPKTAARSVNRIKARIDHPACPKQFPESDTTMSMPDGRLSCTACDYRGFMVFRRITLAYHFADGATVHGHRGIRWCNECRNPCDAEGAQPAIEPLQIELDALNSTFATPGYRAKRWIARLLGQGAGTLEVRADDLRGQIRLAQTRGDECRCLTCGSANTQLLNFDDDGVCNGFQHHCGGHLRLEPVDMDAPRFNYGRETVHLDETGQRIQLGTSSEGT